MDRWCGLEPLEPRLLFAATLVEPLGDLYVMNLQSTSVDLKPHFNADAALTGTVVQFNSSLGTFYAEMLIGDAAATVTNFLRYIDAGRYVDTFIHRSADLANGDDFVIQGGGFVELAADPQFEVVPVQTFGTIQNQFKNSNLRGTLAMARTNEVNSATSQWFVNVSDNTFLDSSNGGFTVFGRVLGDGMNVVDAIAALPTYNKSAELSNGALGELPLVGYQEGDPLTHAHLVAFSSIERQVAAPTVTTNKPHFFQDNGLLIDAQGQLQLKFSGRVGFVKVTVTVPDKLGGEPVSDTFRIRVSPSTGRMGVRDENRRTVVFGVTGGAMIVGTNTQRQIDQVSVIGTSNTSRLSIRPLGGKRAAVGDISISSGPTHSITAPRIDLTGQLFITHVTGSIRFRDMRDGGFINIFGIGQTTETVDIRLRDVSESRITSQLPISSLRVTQWLDDDTTADIVGAPWIGDLDSTGRGRGKRRVAGDFEADLALSSATVDKSLSTAEIRGAIEGATWRATRSIGSIVAARVVDSTIYAGVKPTVSGLPDGAADFTTTPTGLSDASINILQVPGARRSTDPAFVNSVIAARDINIVALGLVQTANTGTPHGFTAKTEHPFESFTYTDAAGTLQDVRAAKDDDDFEVRLV